MNKESFLWLTKILHSILSLHTNQKKNLCEFHRRHSPQINISVFRFDISGRVTGFGNPAWAKTHPTATATAPTILALTQAGAICIGKTVMDEMAYR